MLLVAVSKKKSVGDIQDGQPPPMSDTRHNVAQVASPAPPLVHPQKPTPKVTSQDPPSISQGTDPRLEEQDASLSFYDSEYSESTAGVTPPEPRDITGLASFLSNQVSLPIATLLRGHPTLARDLVDWLQGNLPGTTTGHQPQVV